MANEGRPWFACRPPRYPFMINYIVATNVERFVRFAFGAHIAEVYRSPYMVLLLPINQSGRCAVPTGWFSELILPDYRPSAAAGRRVINLSGRVPDQLPTPVPSASTCDRRSTGQPRATSRQSTSSIRHGPYQLPVAKGPGC